MQSNTALVQFRIYTNIYWNKGFLTVRPRFWA